MQRETQVFPAHLAVPVSLALKERLVSPVHPAQQATLALLGLQDWLFKAPKDSKDPLGHLEEQVKHLNIKFVTTCAARNCCLVFCQICQTLIKW